VSTPPLLVYIWGFDLGVSRLYTIGIFAASQFQLFIKLRGGPTIGAGAKEKEGGRGRDEGRYVFCLMATVR
jgi:hypothetical protein